MRIARGYGKKKCESFRGCVFFPPLEFPFNIIYYSMIYNIWGNGRLGEEKVPYFIVEVVDEEGFALYFEDTWGEESGGNLVHENKRGLGLVKTDFLNVLD